MIEFVFIIPFRSVSTTHDWAAVCGLLESTIASACNSRDVRFRVLVVCHEIPDIRFDADKCSFVRVDFAPPGRETLDLPAAERFLVWSADKGRKVLLGIQEARRQRTRFFMVLDADDLVSSRIVGHCLTRDHASGYYIDLGFRMDDEQPGWLIRRKSFFKECGSSFILRTSRAPFPTQLDLTRGMDDYFIRRYVTHAYIPRTMHSRGEPLEKVPFQGAIYRFHRENTYARSLRPQDSPMRHHARKLFKGLRWSAEIEDEFGAAAAASDPQATWDSTLQPRLAS